jgi:hypothetical protein
VANRIFYGCLGIANCNGTPIQGVQSVGLSVSRSISTIFTPGNKTLAGKYSNLPDIELSYTKYLESTTSFESEPGLSGYTGYVLLAGEDTSKCLGIGSLSTIGFTNLLLSSVSYTMSVDGPFTIERKYKGWSTGACVNAGLGVFANCASNISSSLKRKGCFNAVSIPSEVSPHTIQSVTITFSVNRDFINQFATRKPYASYINFPIETTCTFDVIAKSLTNISFPEPTVCSNVSAAENNISISVGGGSIQVSKAILTALNYSGGDAKKGGSNLKISATYTSYETPASVKPFIIL